MIRNNFKFIAVLFLFVLLTASSVFAGNFILKYEKVVTDSYGNEVGYTTTVIKDINQLPANSPWRDYLNLKLDSGKTIYEYASGIAGSLNKNLTLTLSDRDSNSYSYKDSSSYCVNIFNYVNNYTSDASKKFLFLHEFGHSTMLNSYPSSYDFNNLDYGTDGAHYLDEILPNYNTAWVEGWANAFGAYNNSGMVFSVSMNSTSSLSFLKDKTFDQCARNELFVSKTIYDLMKQAQGGQSSVYDAFAKTGPHSSLYEFCNEYIKLYPENKALLAQILIENSLGNATLDDILLYVNGGSRTVSRDLYNYLVSAGLLNSNGTQTASKPTTTTTTTTKKQGFFSRLISWFANLFNSNKTKGTVASATGSFSESIPDFTSMRLDGNMSVRGSVKGHTAASTPLVNSEKVIDDGSIKNVDSMGLEEAYQEYNKYYSQYEQMLKSNEMNQKKLNDTLLKMNTAKARFNALKNQ